LPPPAQTPPAPSVENLLARARGLVGASVREVAGSLGLEAGGDAVRTKGAGGAILERALGATGGPGRVHDFPELGVELKTLPVDGRGAPLESTYVCTLSLADAEFQEWADSWVRAKLARVLFVPLVGERGEPWAGRRVAAPLLWSPTPAQEDVLRADFEEVVGLVGAGRVEDLTAHLGRWLQVRPKAAHGGVRTIAFGPEGEPIATVPRGFYLRPRFTGALLADPAAVPP
jgi:DNA mismatch repair protein MutH